MKVTLTALLSIGVLALAGSGMVAAPGQTRPGDISPANVWVQNRSPSEAIPVALVGVAQPLQVQITGTAPAGGGATVVTRAARQTWEYLQMKIGPGQDAATMLNPAGAEGWEATGIQFASAGGTVIVLKRPR